MSTTWKVSSAVVIVALIALGIYLVTAHKAAAPAADTATLPSGTASDDAALDKDMQSMDAQIQAFASDDASIDSGLNDQQVEQSSL